VVVWAPCLVEMVATPEDVSGEEAMALAETVVMEVAAEVEDG